MRDLQEYDHISLIEARERVVNQLKLNYAHDNIDEKELERLIEAAHAAGGKHELMEIIRDLPRFDDEERAAEANDAPPVRLNRGRVSEHDTMIAILGGT